MVNGPRRSGWSAMVRAAGRVGSARWWLGMGGLPGCAGGDAVVVGEGGQDAAGCGDGAFGGVLAFPFPGPTAVAEAAGGAGCGGVGVGALPGGVPGVVGWLVVAGVVPALFGCGEGGCVGGGAAQQVPDVFVVTAVVGGQVGVGEDRLAEPHGE